MYNQLSREHRYAIYLGLQKKKSFTAIARQINRPVSTVSREVRRNTNRHGHYIFKEAVELTEVRREHSVSNRRMPAHVLKEAMKLLIDEDWSPRQISGFLRKQGIYISHERRMFFNFVFMFPWIKSRRPKRNPKIRKKIH